MTKDKDLYVLSTDELEVEIMRLRTAIRYCRDQKGDDRCWMDLERLYKLLPEGYEPPVQDTCVMLENCKKYIESCNNPGVTYVSPQRRIEELEWQLKAIKKFYPNVDVDLAVYNYQEIISAPIEVDCKDDCES